MFYGFAPAKVAEEECQTTGTLAYRYQVAWSEIENDGASPQHFVLALQALPGALGQTHAKGSPGPMPTSSAQTWMRLARRAA